MQLSLVLALFALLFLASRQLQSQVSGLFLHIAGRQKTAIWLMALTFLPGTLVHELAHFLMARLLLVKSSAPQLWPRIDGDRVIMGHVMVAKVDPLRMFLIGVAPFLVGLLALSGIFWLSINYQVWTLAWYWQALVGFAVFQLSNCLFLSGADLRQMVKLTAILALLAIIAYLAGLRPTWDYLISLLDQNQPMLLLASLFLAIPLILNLVMILIVVSIKRLVRS